MSVREGNRGTPLVSPISPLDRSQDLDQSNTDRRKHHSILRTTPELDDSGVTSRTPQHDKYKDIETEAYESSARSPASTEYTEQWEDYFSSPRKSEYGQTTHRSKESGRLSPTLESTSVTIGKQPLTIPRFNEPLKLRKGHQFVDYETPAPTVVYVPHRSFTHGRWTNVSVQKKNDGKYVVIEQRPVHTQFTADTHDGKNVYGKDIFGPEKPWTQKKAPWSWSTKGNYIERQINRAFYGPYLPPMKPRYDSVEPRIDSLDNYNYMPGGGEHKVPSFKLKWDAKAKVNSLPTTARDNISPLHELRLPSVSPRYGASGDSGSFTSIHYTPGGNVFLRRQRYDARSQIGSLDNISHTPSGGDVSIPRKSVKWKKESKIGSLDNVTHLPKSSNVQVFSEKLDWNTRSKINSMKNVDHQPKRRRFRVPSFQQEWGKSATARVNSLANVNHNPRGGNVQIIDQKLKWNAKPKVESRWKMNYDYHNLFESDEDELRHDNYSHAGSVPYTV